MRRPCRAAQSGVRRCHDIAATQPRTTAKSGISQHRLILTTQQRRSRRPFRRPRANGVTGCRRVVILTAGNIDVPYGPLIPSWPGLTRPSRQGGVAIDGRVKPSHDGRGGPCDPTESQSSGRLVLRDFSSQILVQMTYIMGWRLGLRGFGSGFPAPWSERQFCCVDQIEPTHFTIDFLGDLLRRSKQPRVGTVAVSHSVVRLQERGIGLGHLPLRNPIVDSMRIAFPRAVKSPSRSFQMNVAFWQQSCPTGIETAESCGRLNSPVSMPIITNARAAGRIVPPTAGDPRSEPVTGIMESIDDNPGLLPDAAGNWAEDLSQAGRRRRPRERLAAAAPYGGHHGRLRVRSVRGDIGREFRTRISRNEHR